MVYDQSVDEVVLRLGGADDWVEVPRLGRRVQSSGRGGRVRVDGGDGQDTLRVTLPDQPPSGMAEGPGAIASNVEQVAFANTTTQDAPNWVLQSLRLRYGQQDLLRTAGAQSTTITLGDGVDTLRIEGTSPDQGVVQVNLGGGADLSDLGPYLGAMQTPVVLQAGPPGNADRVVVRHEGSFMPHQTSRGTLTSTCLTGLEMPDTARVEYQGFATSPELILGGNSAYDMTIHEVTLPTRIQLTSRLADTVTVKRPLASVDVDGGMGNDGLVLVPGRDMEPVVASLNDPALGFAARVAISAPSPAAVNLKGIESLELQLGDNSDTFSDDSRAGFVFLSTAVVGGGGDDQVVIRHTTTPIAFDAGTGHDSLMLEVRDPLSADNVDLPNRVSWTPGLEQIVISDGSVDTVSTDWTVSPEGLRAAPAVGGNSLLLLDAKIQYAEEVLLRVGSDSDRVHIEEPSDQPVRAVVDVGRIDLAGWFTGSSTPEPRQYAIRYERAGEPDAPLESVSLLTGAGDDIVSLLRPARSDTLLVDTAGGGDRVVVLQVDGGTTQLHTGSGTDHVELRSRGSLGALTVETADDNDRIELMQLGSDSEPEFDAGSGTDSIRVLGYRMKSDVSSVRGGDPVGIRGDNLIFDAGSGLCDGHPTVPAGDVQLFGGSYHVFYGGIENLQCLERSVVVSIDAITAIREGESLTLRASSTVTAESFAWDLNGDGDFVDAVGQAPVVTWKTLRQQLSVDDDGDYEVAVRLTQGNVISQSVATLRIDNTPPAPAVKVWPLHVDAGETVELRLNAVDPGDDHITRWDVDWGDGQRASYPSDAAAVEHVYERPGFVYEIGVTATDDDGVYEFPVQSVDVEAPGPVAGNPLVPYRVSEGGALAMHATAAGTPTEWVWDINNDGVFADAYGPDPVVSWKTLESLNIRDGNATTDGHAVAYYAQVLVTYAGGMQKRSDLEARVPIYVSNTRPSGTLTNGGPVQEGATVLLTLATPWDPASADRDVGFTWQIGEGRPHHVAAGASLTVPFQVAHSPIQQVSGVLGDKDSGFARLLTNVTVIDVPPTLNLQGTDQVDEDATYSLLLSAQDPGDDVVSKWTVDWGDGQTDAVQGATAELQHVFVDEGDYTVTVTATDADGSYSSVKTVLVQPLPARLMLIGLPTADEGGPYRLFFTPTTPGDEVTDWRIDWGDGIQETVDRNAGSLTHRYTDNGSYAIRATAQDAHNPRLPRYEVTRVYTLPNPLYGDLADGGNCYVASAVRGDFDTVATWAMNQGGYLVSIGSEAEESLFASRSVSKRGHVSGSVCTRTPRLRRRLRFREARSPAGTPRTRVAIRRPNGKRHTARWLGSGSRRDTLPLDRKRRPRTGSCVPRTRLTWT